MILTVHPVCFWGPFITLFIWPCWTNAFWIVFYVLQSFALWLAIADCCIKFTAGAVEAHCLTACSGTTSHSRTWFTIFERSWRYSSFLSRPDGCHSRLWPSLEAPEPWGECENVHRENVSHSKSLHIIFWKLRTVQSGFDFWDLSLHSKSHRFNN